MIEKPIHIEPSTPVEGEKPSTNGSQHRIAGNSPRIGGRYRLAIAGAISIIAILAFIPGWIQKWLWMDQVGYSSV
ncbi:MAG: hypothetical protein ABI833_21360, partial [Acidobacteriota bacterium]